MKSTTKSGKNSSKVRRSPECISSTKETKTSLTRNRVTSRNNILNEVSLSTTSNFKRTKWTYLRSSAKNMTVISPLWCISIRYKTVIFRRSRCCYLIWNCISSTWCNSKCCIRSNFNTTICSSGISGYGSTIFYTIG